MTAITIDLTPEQFATLQAQICGVQPVPTPPPPTPNPNPPPGDVPLVATLDPNGVPSAPFAVNGDTIYYVQCNGAGSFTWAPGGSPPCWASTDPTFPNDQSKTSFGAGTTPPLAVPAGPVYIKIDQAGTWPSALASLNP